MARIRSVKPDFWTDGNMIGLSFAARLFYIGTWNFSLCDRGHLPDDPMGLKLKILPADDVDPIALLGELLVRGRLVRRRAPDGRTYLFNPRLGEHQKTDARWTSRCPHCASEEAGGFTEEAVSLPEPRPNSPEPAEPPRTSAQDSKGEEGIGKDGVPPAAGTSLALVPTPETATRRSKRITDAYHAVEPMSKWPAVNGIVLKAIKANRWQDDEIHDALLRLAAEGRPVTVETLRVELNGLPPPRAAPRPSTTNSRVDAALALAAELERQEIEP
jgi:hypothetical protein